MDKFTSIMKSGAKQCAVFFHKCNSKPGFRSLIAALISVFVGLFCGFLLMLCVSPQYSGVGFWTLISAGFSSASLFDLAVYRAIPMILSGLAIAFAFKLNLFNIGITGQVTIGAFASIVTGLAGGNWFVCMLVGALSGAVAGFIPGFLKAKFNVNEVLSGILLNWIIYYLIGIIGSLSIPSTFKNTTTPSELRTLPEAARMPSLGIPGMENINVGLIFAIIIVIAIFVVLNKTTFGFELKMTGRNKEASKYAGVGQTKAIILSLTISGALAGLCGYMLYSDPISPSRFTWDSSANTLLSDGFNGISVSLIAQNSPIGCIFSSLLLTILDAAQNNIKAVSNSAYNNHYTELIKNIVIYVAAFSSFFVMILTKLNERHSELTFMRRKEEVNAKKEG